jgi:hypothetical protein
MRFDLCVISVLQVFRCFTKHFTISPNVSLQMFREKQDMIEMKHVAIRPLFSHILLFRETEIARSTKTRVWQPQLLYFATVSRNVPSFAVSRNGCEPSEKFCEIAYLACFARQQYTVSSKTP